MSKLSRRDFMKGAAASAVGMAAMGIFAGCASAENSTTAAKETTAENTTPSTSAATQEITPEVEKASWETPPAAITKDQIAEEYTADVVVIGAGHAGTSCARAAAENGATVILAEEQEEDMYFLFGSEYGGINSKYMIDKWGYEPVDKKACYNDWMMRNAWRCNAAFVKTYVDKSGETFDWLMEPLDQEFIDAFSTNGLPGPLYNSGMQNNQNTWPCSIEMNNSSVVQKAGMAKMLSCNAENKMLWGCSLDQLVKEGERVVAAIVRKADGSYVRLNGTKGVVVATGGFAGNKEMCHDIYVNIVNKYPKKMQDTVDVSYPMVPRMGRGHQACLWAGAIWEPDTPASMSWQNPSGFNPFNMAKFALSNLWLDENGNRYVNEGGDFQLSGLQGQFLPMREDGSIRIMSVFDSSLLEDLQYQQAGHATSCINDGVVGAKLVADIKAGMQATIDAGDAGYQAPWLVANGSTYPVYAGNTPEQLADRMGLTDTVKDNFIASIKRYNELCDQGSDEDFFKDSELMLPLKDAPLFGYVMDYRLTVGLTTLTGMWTDDNQCCLDENHKPIEGLYATGNVCGRRWIGQYATSVAGQSVALANTLGKELGEHLAKKA